MSLVQALRLPDLIAPSPADEVDSQLLLRIEMKADVDWTLDLTDVLQQLAEDAIRDELNRRERADEPS